MKKLCAALACLALLVSLALTGAQAALSYPFTTVTTDSVRMRRSASSTAIVLETLPQGETVTVTGERGSYFAVEYAGRKGYILKQYLSVESDVMVTIAPAATPTAGGYPYSTTTNTKASLLAKADRKSTRLATIPKGATVEMLSLGRTFAHLTYKGQEGYVIKEYVNLLPIVKVKATEAPAVEVAPVDDASTYQVLQTGSAGSAVIALQNALKELGFLSGAVDGQFGRATEQAVIAFQNRNEYPATGVVDANLQAFLYSGSPKNAAGSKTNVKTLAPVEGVTIRQGNTGEQVGTVQIRLRELGYYAGEITMVHDSETVKAVKAFQKANGLTADGKVGGTTWSLLFSGSAFAAGVTATPVPTAVPTPAPTMARPGTTVRQGAKGADAKMVQNRLKALGYFTNRVDGLFGDRSVKALKAFQENNGLTPDGIAGPDTYDVLFSANALKANQKPTPTPVPTEVPTPTPEPTPLTAENALVIKLGVTGEEVRSLQQRLTALGYYQATADGTCKADDVAAIRAFQKKNGLRVDGAAGYETQVRLYSSSAVMYSGAVAGGTVDDFSTLKLGMTGEAVRALQERLIELKYLFGKADGVYGTDTANAVIAFQRANNLSRDGIAGSTTLAKLYAGSAKAASSTPTAAPATASASASLKQGDKGSDVTSLQKRLIELGYLSGKADGTFGSLTAKALVAFQKANKLSSDGIAGAATLAALNSSSAVNASGKTQAASTTALASTATATATATKPSASSVRYANWYTEVKAAARKYQYATVYDYATGISWQVHMFSFGAHADAEPLTANDTAKMIRAFGGKTTWNPKGVWVTLSNGVTYMATIHDMPHETSHIMDNNFDGHLCIHFPRTAAEVASIGPYATSHQAAVDAGWSYTQKLAGN